MHPRVRRAGHALLAVMAVVMGQIAGVIPAHAAIGLPVVIDDFKGTTLGTRTVTLLPTPGTSTTAQGTFQQNGDGTATMTMNGNGNGVGGVQLDYTPASPADLVSSTNTQFFIDFHAIQRLPVQTVGETALNLSIQVTDSSGNGGTLNTGISNVFAFSPALPFSGFQHPPSQPAPDFTHITKVSIQLRYPQNQDSTASLTVVMSLTRATPDGGTPPAVPAATVTVVPPTTTCPADSVHFTVAFTSSGQPQGVTFHPPTPSDIGLRAQDVLISGNAPGALSAVVAGGASTYDVAVSGMTGDGTVSIHIPAGVVFDAWGQANTASTSDPSANFLFFVPPTFTSANASTFKVGTAGSFPVTACGRPTPNVTLTSGALPAGLSLTGGSLTGTPLSGTGGTHRLTFTAHNGVVPDATQTFTLTVNEAPSITSASNTTFTVGTAGTFTVTTGHQFPTPPTLSHTGGLPGGVTFTDNGDGTATLAGTPTAGAGGTHPLTFTAHNGVVPDATQTFTLTVNEAPSITSATTATFVVGAPGSFTVTTTGFPAPSLSESGPLPAGVTFTAATGVLSGTPAANTGGSYPITFTAHNGIGPDATQSFMLTVPVPAGYFEVAADGEVFSFGAPFFGSEGAGRLNAPVVGMAPTPDGKGYWLVAADGGIFTHGDAGFFGSEGARRLNAPVVGIAANL